MAFLYPFAIFLLVRFLFVTSIVIFSTFFSILHFSPPKSLNTGSTSGYSLVVKPLSNIEYAVTINFTVILTFPQPITQLNLNSFCYVFNSQQLCYGNSNYSNFKDIINNNIVTIYFSQQQTATPTPIGAYTMSATYQINSTTTLQSNTISFNVIKDIPVLQCLGQGWLLKIHSQKTFDLYVELESDVIQNTPQASYDVSLVGPAIFTYKNLSLDSSQNLHIPMPQVPGKYTINCTYNGDNYDSPITTSQSGIYFSLGLSIGGPIQLYSNPTPIVAGKQLQLYVVIPGQPGYPPPTGNIYFGTGGYTTNDIPLNSNGSQIVNLYIQFLNGQITVNYIGDANYAGYSQTFGVNVPPFPSSGGSGKPAATATPKPKPTATAEATATIAPPVTPAPSATPILSAGASNSSGLPINGIIITVIAILLAGGAATGVFILRRRKIQA